MSPKLPYFFIRFLDGCDGCLNNAGVRMVIKFSLSQTVNYFYVTVETLEAYNKNFTKKVTIDCLVVE